MFVTHPRWSWFPSIPDADRAVTTTAHPHMPDEHEPKPASIGMQVPKAVKMAVRNHDVRSHLNGSGWQTTNCACCGRDIKFALRSRPRDRQSACGSASLDDDFLDVGRRAAGIGGRTKPQVQFSLLQEAPAATSGQSAALPVEPKLTKSSSGEVRPRPTASLKGHLTVDCHWRGDLLRAREVQNKRSQVLGVRCQFSRDWHWTGGPSIAKIR